MTAYDINLCQGDSAWISVILKENGVGANLDGTTITFSAINEAGTVITVDCEPGAIIGGVEYPITEGGVTAIFTSTDTETPANYMGKFTVLNQDSQTTWPSGNDYVSVRIWESV